MNCTLENCTRNSLKTIELNGGRVTATVCIYTISFIANYAKAVMSYDASRSMVVGVIIHANGNVRVEQEMIIIVRQ